MPSEDPTSAGADGTSIPDYLNNLSQAEQDALAARRNEFRDLAQPVLPWLKASAVPSDAWGSDDRLGPRPRMGVALSGGGIRSATFCLGIFQALARAKCIRYIDYLSTVSGGGYFGAFLGRLFTRSDSELRKGLASPGGLSPNSSRVDLVETILASDSKPVNWLRENGRYLSPNGAGDFFVGAASVLRAWVAIHVVLATFVLMCFIFGNFLRCVLDQTDIVAGRASGLGTVGIWWSPYVLLPLVLLVFIAVPVGWAFWLVLGDKPTFGGRHLTSIVVLLVSGALAIVAFRPDFVARGLGVVMPGIQLPGSVVLSADVLFAITVLTLFAYTVGYLLPLWRALAADGDDSELVAKARRGLTTFLAATLGLVVAALLFALVDTTGQMLYAKVRSLMVHGNPTSYANAAASFVAVCSAVVLFARKIADLFGSSSQSRWVQLPLDLLASLAALVLIAVVLVSLNAVSHGVAWGWRIPAPPRLVQGQSSSDREYGVKIELAARAKKAAAGDVKYQLAMSSNTTANAPQTSPGKVALQMSYRWLVCSLCVTALLSWAFSRMWLFLNFSSHQPVYNARLQRAYLGASNPARWTGGGTTVLHPVTGDGLVLGDYDPHRCGGPLHFINVTINETVDGKSMIQQQDRKGVGMAVGPCGVSVGVRHHATWEDRRRQLLPPPYDPQKFQVFEVSRQARCGTILPEGLDLGTWAGISGAAFSTGMGTRTSLGLSLLLGIFNVRLGYWWDSGVTPVTRIPKVKRTVGQQIAALVNLVFPVQMYLLDEFTARFHGTARRRWYLSDGGHFENLGAYELIRRRVPLIVVCDGEEDATYTFDGLANLVRKARTDFQADIRFLEGKQLEKYIVEGNLDEDGPDEIGKILGSLDQLRRCYHPETGAGGGSSSSERKFSRAHAALAEVYYDGAPTPGSLLLYVKATITGDEPADVVEYADDHPSFPHESTVDQFFDEAQWESYRRLGDHIGTKLLSAQGRKKPPAPPTPRRRRRGPEPAAPVDNPPAAE